jgi:hypothetical protein
LDDYLHEKIAAVLEGLRVQVKEEGEESVKLEPSLSPTGIFSPSVSPKLQPQRSSQTPSQQSNAGELEQMKQEPLDVEYLDFGDDF